MRGLMLAFIVMLLAACGGPDPRYRIPTQKWNDVVVEVRVMPTPVRPGMNEFLVLTTLEHGRPVDDLIVSLRTDPDKEWQQAIQDGLSGVHRHSLYLPGTHLLYVQLRKKRTDEAVVLEFPLVYENDLQGDSD